MEDNVHVERYTDSPHSAHTRTDSERCYRATRETWVCACVVQTDGNRRAVEVNTLYVLLEVALLLLIYLIPCTRRARCASSVWI